MAEMIGFVGSILILLAWILETMEAVKRHKNLIDLRFATVYIPGVSLLAFYSYSIGNKVYLFLQIAILIIVLFEIFYTMHTKRKK